MTQRNPANDLTPVSITVHRSSDRFEVVFDDGVAFSIPFELMRVYSPSAEVRGHGAGQETLQTGKRGVKIDAVEPVGNYGVKPLFSDGHSSGIFTWANLYELGHNQDAKWLDYMARLQAAGHDDESGRDYPMDA